MPKSTVSKRIGELEAALGARLIQRTSRTSALTDVGQDFYEHARAALIEAESAEAVVRRRQAEPSGIVRLTTSVPTAQLELARLLPTLARALPKVQLQVDVTDRYVDLVQEGVDVAIRSHFAPLPDSGLVQRRLAVEQVIVVAAPAYLREHGTPDHPERLGTHQGIYSHRSLAPWRLRHAELGTVEAKPAVRMVANESAVLLAAALDGLGLVCLPDRICHADLARGHLVHVLTKWTAGEVTTTLLTPHRRGELPAVRAVVDYLARWFADLQDSYQPETRFP